jgi:hypothetical protein
MIDSALTAGCLADTLTDFQRQEIREKKFLRWIAQGGNLSYAEFWSRISNGR